MRMGVVFADANMQISSSLDGTDLLVKLCKLLEHRGHVCHPLANLNSKYSESEI